MGKKIHQLSRTRFYEIFRGIKRRCNEVHNSAYKDYGGRGIKCVWRNLSHFKDDMFNSYNDHLKKFGEYNTTIERVDNNGNYCKENCIWVTRKEQANNRRSNKFLTFRGKTLTVSQWVIEMNLTKNTLKHRLNRGWNIKKALITPMRKYSSF